MLKIFSLLTTTYILCHSTAFADEAVSSRDEGAFNKQKAYMCIQLNKDLNQASQQMLETETEKANISSKIRYLQGAIKERRNLIEDLDQRSYQQNNDNYNQLVDQYESLVDEKAETVVLFNDQQQLHLTQHNSVIRLEQRFNSQCLQQVEITQKLYKEVCLLEKVRWCSAFNFN